MTRMVPAATLALLGVLVQAGCGSARRSEPIRPAMTKMSPEAARGRKVFMAHCHQCHPHGEAGVGPAINNKPLPAFMMRFQVRHGLGAMPAFSEHDIGKGDLDDLIAYMKALRRNG